MRKTFDTENRNIGNSQYAFSSLKSDPQLYSIAQLAANAVYGGLTYEHLQAVAEHGLPVSPFSGCVGCLILPHDVPSFCFALSLLSPFFSFSCS